METELKARYRNKLNKIIIEVFNGEKWIYVKTLSDPLVEFNAECLAKVSQNKAKKEENTSQKFSYEILNEPTKQDTSSHVTVKEAQEALNKLMNDILKK